MLLLQSTTAYAQLPTLGDLLNSIIILNGQVADHTNSLATLNVDLNVLNGQTVTNTNAITQLGYDVNVVTAQLAANGTVITALDGRLGSVEGILPPVLARTTALEAAVTGQVSATAANTTAIVAANTRLNGQDALIAANVNVGVQNTAAINVNANAIVDIDARVDAHDISIAQNTANITVNANAIVAVDARVDAHDVVLAQHTTNITNATNMAINAQNSSTTLRNEIVAGQIGLVQQQTPNSTVTVAAQTGGTVVSVAGTSGNRRITGVADGVGPSDAATVGQVAQAQTQAVSIANDYTDRSIANIVGRYDDHTNSLIAANNSVIRRDINAAAASTAAISSLPHSIMPGEGMGAVGIGGRGDSVAFAIGVSKAFRVEHTPIVRAGASIDAHTGTLSYNAGVGVHF